MGVDSIPDSIPDAELKLLQTLWEKRFQTMRELTEAVYPDGGASDYATVQKLLERLLEKGLVNKDTAKWPYIFQAALPPKEVAARMAAATAARVMGLRSAAGLLTGPMRIVVESAMAGASMARSVLEPQTDKDQAEGDTSSDTKLETPTAVDKPDKKKRQKKDKDTVIR